MEKRNMKMYEIQPTLTNFGLHTENKNYFARDEAAVAVAIANEKDVEIKPEYSVYLHGSVEIAPPNRGIQSGDLINTPRIVGLYFERVFVKGSPRMDLYINTENATYLIRDYRKHMRPSMRRLLHRAIESEGMTFESCAGYFSKIEENHPEVEIVS